MAASQVLREDGGVGGCVGCCLRMGPFCASMEPLETVVVEPTSQSETFGEVAVSEDGSGAAVNLKGKITMIKIGQTSLQNPLGRSSHISLIAS